MRLVMWLCGAAVSSSAWECANGVRWPHEEGKKQREEDVFEGTRSHVVVVVPSVQGGLSQQRMRMVQDTFAAASMGYPVQLPERAGAARLWDVYDERVAMERLKALSICVVKSATRSAIEVAPIEWPLATSDLDLAARRVKTWLGDRKKFALAEATASELLLPDSTAAVDLLAALNDAFTAAPETARLAARGITEFRRKKHARPSSEKTQTTDGLVCAAHWIEGAWYAAALARAVSRACPGVEALLILGEDSNRVDRAAVAAYFSRVFAAGHSIRVETAASLRVHRNKRKRKTRRDDALAASLDFELGRRADVFVGAPTATFSALLGFVRRSSANVFPRVESYLARVLSLQFPRQAHRDPCAALKPHLLARDSRSSLLRHTCAFDAFPVREFRIVKHHKRQRDAHWPPFTQSSTSVRSSSSVVARDRRNRDRISSAPS